MGVFLLDLTAMSQIIRTLVEYQISVFASSTTAATVVVTVFDVLLAYVALSLSRRRASQFELLALAATVVMIVLVVLDMVQRGG